MYHVFRLHDKRGHPIRCDPSLGTKIGRFLSGRNKHIQYSPDVEWHTIKHAGVAITAMAVQLCEKRIRREQKAAVKGSSGLHGSAVGKRGHRELRWEDIGKNTVAEAQKILSKFQPLSLHLIQSLATPAPRKSDASTSLPRTTRPPARRWQQRS
ncbi:hypothetical protein OH76DRAFT_1407967 [Lentinus brumalis]|uniref:Uncharacterized protein n=1 Tax=Lentinus brumalis TaxID=2498619 RepID=A0A371CZ54_9APHY|nr:hypothetical protein OH76DRAFT_1407967 [Polyporus brumalis]